MYNRRPPKSALPSLPRLRPIAEALFLIGHVLLLLALEDYTLRLATVPSPEAVLYLEHFAGAVSSSLVLLWMSVLGLDLLERKNNRTR